MQEASSTATPPVPSQPQPEPDPAAMERRRLLMLARAFLALTEHLPQPTDLKGAALAALLRTVARLIGPQLEPAMARTKPSTLRLWVNSLRLTLSAVDNSEFSDEGFAQLVAVMLVDIEAGRAVEGQSDAARAEA